MSLLPIKQEFAASYFQDLQFQSKSPSFTFTLQQNFCFTEYTSNSGLHHHPSVFQWSLNNGPNFVPAYDLIDFAQEYMQIELDCSLQQIIFYTCKFRDLN